MSRPLIIANWKVNPDAPGRAVLLARKIEREISRMRGAEVVIAPPFPFLGRVGAVLKKARLGAQDMFWADGPYTGEVSWHELKHMGVSYVIIGHSERRIHLGETDEMVNKKIDAALRHRLVPVLCVGERERHDDAIPAFVGEQLKKALAGISRRFVKELVVAYEPVWAISTTPGAEPDTPDNAFRAMVYIRRTLADLYGRKIAEKIRIIYGGSVRETNIREYLREGKMQGALVGGASLSAESFSAVIREATRS